jgi:pimeloyl-ACP methyl ester carboxylesterase
MPRLRTVLATAAVLLAAGIALLYRPDVAPEALRARYAPPPSRFVRVGGMDVHYRDEGTGPAVVLLHGMGGSLHTWDGWTAALHDSLRVLRVDLPGYGLTGPLPSMAITGTRRTSPSSTRSSTRWACARRRSPATRWAGRSHGATPWRIRRASSG